MNDRELENAIDRAALLLETAATPGARRKAWDRLQTLLSQRSNEQIERMERERFGQTFTGREALPGGK